MRYKKTFGLLCMLALLLLPLTAAVAAASTLKSLDTKDLLSDNVNGDAVSNGFALNTNTSANIGAATYAGGCYAINSDTSGHTSWLAALTAPERGNTNETPVYTDNMAGLIAESYFNHAQAATTWPSGTFPSEVLMNLKWPCYHIHVADNPTMTTGTVLRL